MLVAELTWKSRPFGVNQNLSIHTLTVSNYELPIFIFTDNEFSKSTLESTGSKLHFEGPDHLERAKDTAHWLVNAFRTELM